MKRVDMQMHFGDAQEQALALAGWNQDYLQLGAGAFHGELHMAQAAGMRLFVERLQQPVWQSGVLPAGMLALGVPLQAAGPGVFCGTACGPDTLHVFSGTGGFEFRSSPRHAMLGIEVPAHLPGLAHALAHDVEDHTMQAGAWHMPQALAAQVRTQLMALFDSARSQPEVFAQVPVWASAIDFLLQTVVTATDTSDRGGACSHWKLVQRARALVRARPEQTLSVALLCAELGVSRRTLQSGFQQVLGMGPLAYLKAVRLRQARHALQQGHGVSDAATASGFWHFGHFAHDYAAMFGERPSETLRRHAARTGLRGQVR